jgi:hypothetical protein
MACPDTTDEACLRRLATHPPLLTRDRLPAGGKIGRCLLQIDGKTLISGACAYSIGEGGDFHIDGPHQVFDGIDYPKADGMAAMISTDWWADVFREDDGWTGYSNGDESIGSVHGQASRWGKLKKSDACFTNRKGGEVMQQVRICLWKNR